MSTIITSDLHFTLSPRDEYRWALFPWLQAQVRKNKVSDLLILGDLTDAKDRHSSVLVNRIADELAQLAEQTRVILLKGNHDYIDEACPFFHFLRWIGQGFDYVNEPTELEVEGDPSLFLPSTRNLDDLFKFNLKKVRYIFMHHTFHGAVSENGTKLTGVSPQEFADFMGEVVSGDVHVPQKVAKNITYVGAPYRVHFGDTFKPRVLLLNSGQMFDLYPNLVSREVMDIDTPSDLKGNFPEGTQIKVRVHLKRQQFGERAQLRGAVLKQIARYGYELCGLEWKMIKVNPIDVSEETETAESPADVVRAYAKSKKLGKDTRTLGLELVKEAVNK